MWVRGVFKWLEVEVRCVQALEFTVVGSLMLDALVCHVPCCALPPCVQGVAVATWHPRCLAVHQDGVALHWYCVCDNVVTALVAGWCLLCLSRYVIVVFVSTSLRSSGLPVILEWLKEWQFVWLKMLLCAWLEWRKRPEGPQFE